jgi:hypothetical protein
MFGAKRCTETATVPHPRDGVGERPVGGEVALESAVDATGVRMPV